MDNGQIIIVDDDIFIVNLLQDILSEKSYHVVPFNSSSQVLGYALDNPPDLFLLDINMPGIDGLELCRMIKNEPALEPVPVIFISGALEGREKARGFDVGGSDYITKPFVAKDVLSRVRTHIRLKKSMEEILNFNVKLESEIEKRTRELKIEKERAEKANAAKSLFLSQINHELRTPLNGILGMLHLLKKNNSDEESNELYLNLADYSAKHLSFLINNMLDYTQLENHTILFRYRELSVRTIFENLESLYITQCREKGVTLKICHPELSGPFVGDLDRLLQILNNLVNNAIKYSEKGEILIKYTYEKGLDVSIKNEGPEIPEDIREEIFKPFVTQANRYVKDQSGLGLGLAIVQNLVLAMDGSIDFTSGNHDTVFHIHIPEHEANGENTREPKDDRELKSLSVLLVEDDVVSMYYLEKLLEDSGCRVVQVINGEEALAELIENTYDLVLMDIGLPELSGLQVMNDIRKIKEDFQIPVIAVTAFSQKEDIHRFYQSGFSDILIKPVSEKNLFSTIKKYIP